MLGKPITWSAGWRVIAVVLTVALLMSIAAPFLGGYIPPAAASACPSNVPCWDGTGASITHPPISWPSTWTAYTFGNQTIDDPRIQDPSNGGTRPQNYVNITSGCPDQTLPSVYYAYSGSNTPTLFVRFRIEQIANTYATGPSAGSYGSADPWNAGTWSMLIDTNGDGYRDFVVALNGQTGVPSAPIDTIQTYWASDASNTIDTSDPSVHLLASTYTGFVDSSTDKILNFHSDDSPDTSWPNGAAETVWDYGMTRATSVTTYGSQQGCSAYTEFLVDYQIPLTMLDATSLGGPKITANTPIALMYATANSNTNPLQKDAAFEGSYIASPSQPAPFGDPITLAGGRLGGANFDSIGATGCGPTSLSASVSDLITTTNGTATTTISSANFFYYYDANANGVADDRNSWTYAAAGTVNSSPIGYITGSWDSSGLLKGQYLVGLQVTDTLGMTSSWQTSAGVQDTSLNNTCGSWPSISKTVSQSNVSPGGTVTYTITINNPTSAAITLNTITDSLPLSFTYSSTTGGGTLSPVTSPTGGAGGTINWTFSSTSVNANSTGTLIFKATAASTSGSYLDDALAAITSPTMTLDSGATAEVDVGSPSLDIAKSAAVSSVVPGGYVTYTITYGNSSSIVATNVVISDVLPSGTTYSSASSGGTNNSGTVTWHIGTLSPGVTGQTVTVSLQVASNYSGSTRLINPATILSDQTSPATADASTFVSMNTPDLVLDKRGNAAVAALNGITATEVFTLSYANIGTAAANSTLLTDTLPTGFAYASATGGPTVSGQNVVWSLGSVGAGISGTKTLTATVEISATNPSTNTAYLQGSGTPLVSDSYKVGVSWGCTVDYFEIEHTDINGTPYYHADATPPITGTSVVTNIANSTPTEIARFYTDPPAGQPIPAGTSITTTFYYTTTAGSTPNIDVVYYDYNPSGVITNTAYGTASTSGSASTPTVLPIVTTAPLTTTVPAGDRLLWIVEYDYAHGGPNKFIGVDFGGNVAGVSALSSSGYCPAAPATLVLDKKISSTPIYVTPPNVFTYTLDFGNSGTISTTNSARISDVMPAGISYDGSPTMNGSAYTGTVTQTGQVLTFTVNSTDQPAGSGTVSGGGNGTLTFQAVANTGAGLAGASTVTNTADIFTGTQTLATASAASAVLTPTLSIAKTASADLLIPGDTVTYTLTLLNSGSGAASSVAVTDTLPVTTWFNYTGNATGGASYDSSTHDLTWSGLSLAAGASTPLTFTMQLSSTGIPAGNTALGNQATTGDSAGDVASSNVVSVTISSNPNLTISKSVSPSTTLSAGDKVTYTITYGNIGASDALTTTIRDYLPSDMTYVTSSLTLNGASKTDANDGDGATYDVVNNLVTFSPGTLATTSGLTATYQAQVDSLLPNGTTTFTNTATIAASNAASKSASVTSTATASPVLTVTKTAPQTLAYPETTLAADVNNATTIQVASTSLLNVNDVISIGSGGTMTATIDSIDSSTGNVGLSTAVTGLSGTGVYDTIKYYVAYENTGTATASSVVLTDALPTGISYVSSSPAANTVSGQNVVWDLSSLSPNVPGQVEVIAFPTASGIYTNVASITSAEVATPATSSASTTVGAPVLTKSTTTPNVSQTLNGASATYVISATNPLGSSVSGVYITDTLQSGFYYSETVAYSPPGAPSNVPTLLDNPASWGPFTLGANSSEVITFTAGISKSVGPADYQNSIAAGSSSNVFIGFDPLVTSQEDVTVTEPAVLISKTIATTSINSGGSGTTITYTVALNNTGTADATNVQITDTLPVSPSFTYSTTSSITGVGVTRTSTKNPSPGDTAPSWGYWTIPATTGTLTITFTADAPATALGTYTNTVNATDDQTSISEFKGATVDFGASPTSVTVMGFGARASSSPAGMAITWATASELDVQGFNIWRSEAQDGYGARTEVNAALIPSQGLGGPMGASYSYLDETADPRQAYQYWLEVVTSAGVSQWIGPTPAGTWHIYLPQVGR